MTICTQLSMDETGSPQLFACDYSEMILEVHIRRWIMSSGPHGHAVDDHVPKSRWIRLPYKVPKSGLGLQHAIFSSQTPRLRSADPARRPLAPQLEPSTSNSSGDGRQPITAASGAKQRMRILSTEG